MPRFEVEIEVLEGCKLSVWIYTDRWICVELERMAKDLLRDLTVDKISFAKELNCIRLDYEVSDVGEAKKAIEHDIDRIREVIHELARPMEELVEKLKAKYNVVNVEICPLTGVECTPRCKWYYRPWDCCLLRVDVNQI